MPNRKKKIIFLKTKCYVPNIDYIYRYHEHKQTKRKRIPNFAIDDDDDTDKDGGSISSASPLPVHEIIEHIVKSPPEPTRVKSPEQILMRSPDPVNWTVPLDTGKTFTVTQNVRDGKSHYVCCPLADDRYFD